MESASIVLSHGLNVLSAHTIDASKKAEQLVTRINDMMNASDISYAALNRIIVTNGPGSFTGIRIGMSAVAGLQLTTPNLTVTSIGSLHALAYTAYEMADRAAPLWVINKAGRGEVYAQRFAWDNDAVTSETDAALYKPDALRAELAPSDQLAGNAASMLRDETCLNINMIDMCSLVPVSFDTQESSALSPFYIRPPDATPASNVL